MSDFPERVVITPGSKSDFWVDIVDEALGKPIPLDIYDSGKAIFCNCDGEKIEITLTINNDAAKCGSVFIEIPSSETLKFDKKSINFDLVFVDGINEIIYPVNDFIELLKRNC